MTSAHSWLIIFIITSITAVIAIYFLVKFITNSKTFKFMVINEKESSGSGVRNFINNPDLIGKTGVASTDLRLSGKARFNNKEFQVISSDEYIQKNTNIIIDRIEGNKIFVIKNE